MWLVGGIWELHQRLAIASRESMARFRAHAAEFGAPLGGDLIDNFDVERVAWVLDLLVVFIEARTLVFE